MIFGSIKISRCIKNTAAFFVDFLYLWAFCISCGSGSTPANEPAVIHLGDLLRLAAAVHRFLTIEKIFHIIF